MLFPEALRELHDKPDGTVSRQAWDGRAIELDNGGHLVDAATKTPPYLKIEDIAAKDWWWCPF